MRACLSPATPPTTKGKLDNIKCISTLEEIDRSTTETIAIAAATVGYENRNDETQNFKKTKTKTNTAHTYFGARRRLSPKWPATHQLRLT
jgi:hypothetical protein